MYRLNCCIPALWMGINLNLINSINKYLIKDINIDFTFNTVDLKN